MRKFLTDGDFLLLFAFITFLIVLLLTSLDLAPCYFSGVTEPSKLFKHMAEMEEEFGWVEVLFGTDGWTCR